MSPARRRPLRVLVLCGGRSAEHEISLQSARTVVEHLDPRRYAPAVVVIDRGGRWVLQGGPLAGRPSRGAARPEAFPFLAEEGEPAFDVAFPVLHGPFGEDGTLQGALEMAGLPYVGCGVLASSIGMDKEMAKRLARLAGVLTAPHVVVHSWDAPSRKAPWHLDSLRLGLPLFVKPSGLGSSVGVGRVVHSRELLPAVRRALRYDTKVLVEKAVVGPELAVGVLGGALRAEASVCGQILPRGHDFFSYEAKYLDPEGHELLIPAPIPARHAESARRSALSVFRAIEGWGLARVDFFLERRSGRLFFGEVNTLPGFTSHSLYPKLWEASGLPLPRLLDRLIALALTRHRSRNRLRLRPR